MLPQRKKYVTSTLKPQCIIRAQHVPVSEIQYLKQPLVHTARAMYSKQNPHSPSFQLTCLNWLIANTAKTNSSHQLPPCHGFNFTVLRFFETCYTCCCCCNLPHTALHFCICFGCWASPQNLTPCCLHLSALIHFGTFSHGTSIIIYLTFRDLLNHPRVPTHSELTS